MIANISPTATCVEHTLNTLRYADRVKGGCLMQGGLWPVGNALLLSACCLMLSPAVADLNPPSLTLPHHPPATRRRQSCARTAPSATPAA